MSLDVKSSLMLFLTAYGTWRILSDLVNYVRKCSRSPQNTLELKNLELMNRRKPPELWNRAFFFPDYIPEDPDSITSQIFKLLESSKICIQLCMYLCSFRPFEDVIIQKFRAGLIIQVVTDSDTLKAHSTIGRWRLLGIQVRTKSTGYLMHNKFLIIDDEALMTGSLNWTNQGVTGNQENLLVTTDTRLVECYRKEFCRMWNDSCDIDMAS